MRLATIRDRVYGDFLMPSRLDIYLALVERALTAGYEIVSIESYWALTLDGGIDPTRRYLLLRHDVDTDPATVGLMWQSERRIGAQGSFFFRLSTLDIGLMQAIAADGGDASYHYEELATVARARRPRTAEAALALIPEAQDLFAQNLDRLRSITGLPMRVVASHGDFLNRRMGIKNATILDDPDVRAANGIVLETYDPAFLDSVSSYHRDLIYPGSWMHGDPYAAIDRGEPIIYMLIHPRPWRVDRAGNLRDDIGRLREDVAYRLPARSGRGRS
jgi:hypothetical protein